MLKLLPDISALLELVFWVESVGAPLDRPTRRGRSGICCEDLPEASNGGDPQGRVLGSRFMSDGIYNLIQPSILTKSSPALPRTVRVAYLYNDRWTIFLKKKKFLRALLVSATTF